MPDFPPDCDPSQWLDKYGDFLYRYAIARLRNAEAAAVGEVLVVGSHES